VHPESVVEVCVGNRPQVAPQFSIVDCERPSGRTLMYNPLHFKDPVTNPEVVNREFIANLVGEIL
jgi:hypothetical protein